MARARGEPGAKPLRLGGALPGHPRHPGHPDVCVVPVVSAVSGVPVVSAVSVVPVVPAVPAVPPPSLRYHFFAFGFTRPRRFVVQLSAETRLTVPMVGAGRLGAQTI